MRRLNFLLPLAFALAATFLPGQTAMADDVFAVANVHVDASASSATEAQNAALAQGRPKAWQTLYRRITRAQDWPRQPRLDDTTLQRMIRTFEVANERRSTTRYVADITYRFSPEAVARALQASAIAYTQLQAKRVLVIPMAPGYAHGSAWTFALASPRFANSVVPFSVPAGDALNQTILSGLVFDTATWSDVEPAASRVKASEVVLMLATPTPGHLTVTLRRLSAGQLPAKSGVEVPLAQGGALSTYSNAADAAVRAMEEMWKTHSAVDFSQKGRLTADVRMSSLGQWGSLQSTLATVPNVAGVSVVAMNIGEARISLSYLGTVDQLREALAAQGISLVNRGGDWSLSSASTASAP